MANKWCEIILLNRVLWWTCVHTSVCLLTKYNGIWVTLKGQSQDYLRFWAVGDLYVIFAGSVLSRCDTRNSEFSSRWVFYNPRGLSCWSQFPIKPGTVANITIEVSGVVFRLYRSEGRLHCLWPDSRPCQLGGPTCLTAIYNITVAQ